MQRFAESGAGTNALRQLALSLGPRQVASERLAFGRCPTAFTETSVVKAAEAGEKARRGFERRRFVLSVLRMTDVATQGRRVTAPMHEVVRRLRAGGSCRPDGVNPAGTVVSPAIWVSTSAISLPRDEAIRPEWLARSF